MNRDAQVGRQRWSVPGTGEAARIFRRGEEGGAYGKGDDITSRVRMVGTVLGCPH
ncbi:MAG: hypothetical protein HYU36_12360 [Planctomycetes bacterium]|nr:hypothetical protein [Planctomycetota bacterium]